MAEIDTTNDQSDERTPWVAPAVEIMAAGDAEVGFNHQADGTNSQS